MTGNVRGRADVSPVRDDWDAVMSAASTRLRVSKARMVIASVHGFFGALAPWSVKGLAFLLYFIVTDVLALQMASSRPVPQVAVEAKSFTAAQMMGRSSPSSISEGARAPRHSTTDCLCQSRWWSKKAENQGDSGRIKMSLIMDRRAAVSAAQIGRESGFHRTCTTPPLVATTGVLFGSLGFHIA